MRFSQTWYLDYKGKKSFCSGKVSIKVVELQSDECEIMLVVNLSILLHYSIPLLLWSVL